MVLKLIHSLKLWPADIVRFIEKELPSCDKDLWQRFPEFKEQVVEMQDRFRPQT